MSHIDFAENYTFQIQNEIQSMYFFSESVTILVHITLYRGLPTTEGDGDIIKHSHYYISDDKDHDSLFVQHCLMLHWEWLLGSGFEPKEHWVYSDGCAAQFKGAKALYFVARYPGLTNGCLMRWNFFGSGHGKGSRICCIFILLILRIVVDFSLHFVNITFYLCTRTVASFGICPTSKRVCDFDNITPW